MVASISTNAQPESNDVKNTAAPAIGQVQKSTTRRLGELCGDAFAILDATNSVLGYASGRAVRSVGLGARGAVQGLLGKPLH